MFWCTIFVSGTRLLTITDKSRLHYTNAVLHEVMRIRTIVPVAIPHKTTCDTTVGKERLTQMSSMFFVCNFFSTIVVGNFLAHDDESLNY